MVTRKQAALHNAEVISDVSSALLENYFVNPYDFLKDPGFASHMIEKYIESANAIRPSIGLPKLFLYNLKEFE